ncbi:hypothetical protein F5Y19DRAFT_472299 [Xylariaceae sp. FL1651]|nr:hypothetical protein F5Y19DRAFT_472299 [Xylariaceae sp. FL1651]
MVCGARTLLGRKWSDPDLQASIKDLPYKVSGDNHDKLVIKINVNGREETYTPEYVTGLMIRELKQMAEVTLGIPRIERKIVVFDMGNKLDVSVLVVEAGTFEVLATSSRDVGGKDFDQRIFNHFVEIIRRETVMDPIANQHATQEIKLQVEEAKIALSFNNSTSVDLPFFVNGTGQKYEAKFTIADIDDIVLAGGSAHIPAVVRMVEAFLDKKPSRGLNTSEQETEHGIIVKIAPHSIAIPLRRALNFSTTANGQSSMLIRVLQGERVAAIDDIFLGEFELPPTPAPAGNPRLQVVFEVDANEILNVIATDLTTRTSNNITIVRQSPKMTPNEAELILQISYQTPCTPTAMSILTVQNLPISLRMTVQRLNDSGLMDNSMGLLHLPLNHMQSSFILDTVGDSLSAALVVGLEWTTPFARANAPAWVPGEETVESLLGGRYESTWRTSKTKTLQELSERQKAQLNLIPTWSPQATNPRRSLGKEDIKQLLRLLKESPTYNVHTLAKEFANNGMFDVRHDDAWEIVVTLKMRAQTARLMQTRDLDNDDLRTYSRSIRATLAAQKVRDGLAGPRMNISTQQYVVAGQLSKLDSQRKKEQEEEANREDPDDDNLDIELLRELQSYVQEEYWLLMTQAERDQCDIEAGMTPSLIEPQLRTTLELVRTTWL